MTATQSPQKHEFQAETRKLLDLMIHSLYRNKEIFLRELISNASDALDKLRFEALTRPELMEGDDRLHIRIDRDPADRELVVRDNGIGMSRDEVIANLGTIARSGTQEFAQRLRALENAKEAAPELIGQFGVGFYSCFMIADEVIVDTRKAGETMGVRWRSRGDGAYTVEEIEKKDRGTTITVVLKAPAPGDSDETPDFTQEWLIRDVVRRYSDFVAWPIEMDVEREEATGTDDDPKKERKKIVVTETLNSMRPLWSRAAGEVKPEEHAEFYKHLTHDWEAPRETIHFKAEGNLEYTALLYVPAHRGFDWMETQQQQKSRVSLYVKRVFILADCEELLPSWLRFMRGLVDSADLPLNVSRETLQHTRQMKPMQRRLVAKTLDTLKKMLETDRAKYRSFFQDFGAVLKEGIYGDDEFRKDVAPLALFSSTGEAEDTTLAEYIQRMPVSQKSIYYIAGDDRAKLARSPHLEAFKKKGYEVLLLSDPVDEFAMSRLREYEGRPLKSVERGALDFDTADDSKERSEKKESWKPLAESLKQALGDRVADVRFGDRLTDSVAVLVTDEHGLTPQMVEVLRNAKQDVPETKRILELNPDHPLIARLDATRGDTAKLADYAELLLAQARLAEGGAPDDPQKFNQLVTKLMLG
jgi:molecular chaperone HtpG